MAEKTFADIIQEVTEQSRMMDAPLAERLQVVADAVAKHSPAFATTVERMVTRLRSGGVGETAPRPGEPLPDFMLPDEGGNLVSLGGLLEKGPVVVALQRGHWCPYCRLSVDALAKIAPEVERCGGQIVAISPEKHRYGADLKAYAKAPFPILSDMNSGYALELGLLFWVGDETRAAMSAGGYDLPLYQGNESWMLPIPATFVVRRDGIVVARFVDPDYRHRMDLDVLLAAVKATRISGIQSDV